MSYERLAQLPKRFENTPIYDETLREAMIEKVDLARAKEIMHEIRKGDINVSTILSTDKPTPLAYHILSKFSDMSELMAPERVLLSNIERMKSAIEARTVKMFCMSCGNWSLQEKVRNLKEQPACGKCGSRLLAILYPSQDLSHLQDTWKKRLEDKEVTEEELKELTHARREADLTLSYGKKAIVAMEVKGVGPETASRVLGKMHVKEEEFYMDLLKAKIQYLRTRGFWEDKDRQTKMR
jgi:ATP-dependent helicase Lhr and Lhr-like helicase